MRVFFVSFCICGLLSTAFGAAGATPCEGAFSQVANPAVGFQIQIPKQNLVLRSAGLFETPMRRGGHKLAVFQGMMTTSLGIFAVEVIVDHVGVCNPRDMATLNGMRVMINVMRPDHVSEHLPGTIAVLPKELDLQFLEQIIAVKRLKGAGTAGFRTPVYRGIASSSAGDLEVSGFSDKDGRALQVFMNMGSCNYL